MKKYFFLLTIISLFIAPAFSYSLEELDKAMLQNNPSVRQATETVLQAALDVKDAKANFQPSITLSGSATYMMDPPLGAITMDSATVLSQMGLGSYSDKASGYVTLYDGMENTMYMGALSLTQPLITWGKLSKAVDLYEEAYHAQVFRSSDNTRQLQAELRVRVASLQYLEELFSLLEEAQIYADELVSISLSGYENGMMLKQEYLAAQISAMEVAVRKADLESQYQDVLRGLKNLTGLSELSMEDLEAFDESCLMKYEDAVLDELTKIAVSSSSDNINAVRSLLQVYSLQEDIAKSSMYGLPDFALQVSLSYNGSRIPFNEIGWRQKSSHSVNLSIGFQSTLWDGGKLLNNKKKASSNIRNTEALLDSTKAQISSAVESNYTKMQYALKHTEMLGLKMENLELELSSIQTQKKYGQKSRADEVQKMLEIVTVKSELVAEKIQLVQNVLTLDYLTGVEF